VSDSHSYHTELMRDTRVLE